MSAALRLGALETLTTLHDWGLKLTAISNTVQPALRPLPDCSAFCRAWYNRGIDRPARSFSRTALRALEGTCYSGSQKEW